MLYHVSHDVFDLPTVLAPGRWGQRTRGLKTDSMIDPANRAVLLWETLLESRRQSLRPDVVSRLGCVFACETLESAIRFRDRSMSGAAIYEAEIVRSDALSFRANLETLDGDGSSVPLIDWYLERADRYWREEGLGQHIEMLCASPIRLLRRALIKN